MRVHAGEYETESLGLDREGGGVGASGEEPYQGKGRALELL